MLLYIPPTTAWFRQSAAADRERTELQGLQEEHRGLEERLSTLRGPEAIEREARHLGMVREGERAFVIEEPAEDDR